MATSTTSKEALKVAGKVEHCEGKPQKGSVLLQSSSGTESWRGGVAILQESVRGA